MAWEVQEKMMIEIDTELSEILLNAEYRFEINFHVNKFPVELFSLTMIQPLVLRFVCFLHII